MLPPSRHSKLLRCHLLTPTLCRRRRQNYTAAKCDSPPSPSPSPVGESLLNQALKLVQSPENEWNFDQLRNLLFSDEFSLPHFLKITLSLGSSSKAPNFLECFKSNAPSEENRYPSFIFYGVLKLLIREPISKTRVLELYNIVKEKRVPLTTNSATLLIQALEKAEMPDELVLLFNDLEPSLKSTRIVNKLVRGLLQLGRTDDALKVLEEMFNPNTESPPNDVTGNIVFTEFLKIKSCGRSITEEEIGGLVRKLSKCCVFPNTYKLTQMINKLCRKGKTNLAWDVLHDVMRLGVSVSATSCNALLKGLGKDGDVKRMTDLLTEMKEVKIQPSVLTFGILINHLCKSRRIDDALVVLEKMRGKGESSSGMEVEPNVVIFNTLIDGFCKAGNLDKACELFDEMNMGGVQPDVVTFTTLIVGLCKVGRQEEGLRLLEEMKNHDELRPDTVTYTCLIDGFCKAGNLEKAHELFDEMNKEGVQPDAVTFTTLIFGLCKVGRQEEGLRFLEEMKNHDELWPNTITYSCLIDGFCKVGNLDKAHELFDEMNKGGVQPNTVTVNALLDGMCKHGKIGSAVDFFNEMQKKGIKGDVVTYSVLISAYCIVNNMDKAIQYFNIMLKSGVSPDAIVFNNLISGLSFAGRMDDASYFVSKLKQAGFGLNL